MVTEGEGKDTMGKKLSCIMSALLALSICVPGGAVRAFAEGGNAESSSDVAVTSSTAASSDATTSSSVATSSDVVATSSVVTASNASAFHATITSDKDTYSAGSTAIYAVKYTLDRGAFHEGDTITVNIPTEIASKVRFSVDPLHFSSAVDKGNGVWELTFGPNAATALAGSFSMYITTAAVTTQTTAQVTVGTSSKDLTVIPTGSASGVGTYTDAIMKDANDDKVSYYGYDYSEGMGDDAAQVGVYDSTSDQTIGYRLFVNDKRATMDSITVVDTLPDGMIFDRTRGVRVTDSTEKELDSSLYAVSISGQNLTFTYPGTLADTVWIYYWVTAQGGTNIKYTNHAEIAYRSDGTTYQEHRNYVLQGNNYNAACGEKSVDKTVVSSDPADQLVTYTIKFWNSNGFDVGDINLTDKLDSHVRFVYADATDGFDIAYDEASHSVHVQNTAAISGSQTDYVRFVVDFTDVPEGYTVMNTVGGNTTKTLKMPSVQLSATKTVDGAVPQDGQTFTIQLCDEQGNVLQEKQTVDGSATFDKISYSEDDLAADGGDATIRYTVKEKAGDGTLYTYDDTVYDVAVLLHKQTTDGITTVTAMPSITKDGASVDAMTFDNKTKTTSVSVTKTWVGEAGTSSTIHLLANGTDTGKTLVLSEANGWKGEFSGLAKYDANDVLIAYTVTEDAVEGYTSEISGDAASGFTVTNTKSDTPNTPDEPEPLNPSDSGGNVPSSDTGGSSSLPGTGDSAFVMMAFPIAILASGVAALAIRRRAMVADRGTEGNVRHQVK